MIPVTIFQIAVSLTFLIAVADKFGILPSISDAYRELGPKKRGWVFYLWCIAVGFPMFFFWEQSPWFILSGIGMCTVGTAAAFWDKITNEVHFSGAGMAIVGGFAGVWDTYGVWQISVLFLATAIAMWRRKVPNVTWWVECVALALVLGAMLILPLL